MSKIYDRETFELVLAKFIERYGKVPTITQVEREGGGDLFMRLTNRRLSPSGICQFLKKAKDPDAYADHNRSLLSSRSKKTTSQAGSSNLLFNLIGDKQFILVPSYGDIYCYDSAEEVKEAIEKFQSSNISMIEFKLLKSTPIRVQATVNCQIG